MEIRKNLQTISAQHRDELSQWSCAVIRI